MNELDEAGEWTNERDGRDGRSGQGGQMNEISGAGEVDDWTR
ncbi:hypothetical protein NYE40_02295 [Paenibacillus sp. FSL W8-1187]|uniref:Uncharacterized protein n=1 Tax=Paenibacillus pasadenensis TaxID=217090 RepID=A0A2N5N0T0_9BACL|nr:MULTISPECIES: hypothetical protein [Paenibacillus]PLT43948.1 hypothetical protein B8V81_2379 [Paenibacillus pasadenensis]